MKQIKTIKPIDLREWCLPDTEELLSTLIRQAATGALVNAMQLMQLVDTEEAGERVSKFLKKVASEALTEAVAETSEVHFARDFDKEASPYTMRFRIPLGSEEGFKEFDFDIDLRDTISAVIESYVQVEGGPINDSNDRDTVKAISDALKECAAKLDEALAIPNPE